KYEEPFIYWKERLFITMQYPSSFARNPIYLVGVELSTNKIRETLEQIGSSRGGQTVLMNLDRGWEISGAHDPKLLAEMRAYAKELERSNVQEGYVTLHVDGERYLTVYK
ncbi:sensor histidine kinase, partial [Bacillus cereus]|nr:sensor histidine kinase [Bacillus cereus]